MSVCNGAFTLANTGLLDGLKATTTAGNLNRFRRSYPAIRVVNEERVVDNGRIITTAGLSAGIDGALHMLDVMKGDGAGQTIALYLEYDWRPNGSYVRGTMADRFIPRLDRIMDTLKAGENIDINLKGNNDSWESTVWYSTSLSPVELFAKLKTAYESAYSRDGGPWTPKSFRTEPTGRLTASMRFDDREGRHWKGTLSLDPVEGEANQVVIRIAVDRVG
jgi:hypothetical protein